MIESESIKGDERLTLRKSAKLRHRTLVQNLFEKGRSVYSGPLRVTYRALTQEELSGSFREDIPDMIAPVQFMITVPKKKRRHAVDRVLMRRRIREAFRLRYRDLRRKVEADAGTRTLSLALIYMHTENSDMRAVGAAVESALAKISRRLYGDDTPCGQEAAV